jgi:hypothetical protein
MWGATGISVGATTLRGLYGRIANLVAQFGVAHHPYAENPGSGHGQPSRPSLRVGKFGSN